MIGDMLLIMPDILLEKCIDGCFAEMPLLFDQGFFDQWPYAAADHRARLFEWHRRDVFQRQNQIEGRDQVGRGIDKGAVQIEHDDGI